MSQGATIVWFRQDLRLTDHLGLIAAVNRNKPVVPIYVWHPEVTKQGGASRVWLYQSLQKLNTALKHRGSRLFFFHGSALSVMSDLLKDVRPEALYFHSVVEPEQRAVDDEVCNLASERGVSVRVFNGEGLGTAESYRHKVTGNPYKVRRCLNVESLFHSVNGINN